MGIENWGQVGIYATITLGANQINPHTAISQAKNPN